MKNKPSLNDKQTGMNCLLLFWNIIDVIIEKWFFQYYYVNQHASLVLPMSESEDDLLLILKSDSREEEELELKEETFTIPEIVL